MRITFAVLLAGCATSQAIAPPVANSPATAAASDATAMPIYRDLFKRGVTWTFQSNGADHKRWSSTCTVSETGAGPGDARTSKIACDHLVTEGGDPYAGDAIAGAWLADRDGLWRIEGWDFQSASPKWDTRQLVMPSMPAPITKQITKPERTGTLEVVAQGDGWCATLKEAAEVAPEGGAFDFDTQWCLAHGGIVGGHALSKGDGFTDGTYFTFVSTSAGNASK